VDNTEQPTVVSFCTGYGGIELGLERVFGSIKTLACCEIEAYAIANLITKMETGQMVPCPIWTDLKTFPCEIFRGKVDILTGGYPCQPFSQAGKHGADQDPRHLWPHIKRAIDIIRPELCLFENVEGHVTVGLYDVLNDLGSIGYRTTWGLFTAAEVGAPHLRKRIFIMAVADGFEGWSYAKGRLSDSETRSTSQELVNTEHYGSHGSEIGRGSEATVRDDTQGTDSAGESEGTSSSEELAESKGERIQGFGTGGIEESQTHDGKEIPLRGRQMWPSRPNESQHDWEEPRVVANAELSRRKLNRINSGVGGERKQTKDKGELDEKTESGLGGTTHGSASRVDRLRLLGNGVIPQVAEIAFRTLYERIIKW